MELARDSCSSETGNPKASWWPLGFMEKLHSVSLTSQDENLNFNRTVSDPDHGESLTPMASQILWASGSFSGQAPDGFYSLIPVSESFC